jgi:hypothetical protein
MKAIALADRRYASLDGRNIGSGVYFHGCSDYCIGSALYEVCTGDGMIDFVPARILLILLIVAFSPSSGYCTVEYEKQTENNCSYF